MIGSLGFIEYMLIAGCLLVALALGRWAGRGQAASEDFLIAGRSLGWLPSAFSLAVSGLVPVLALTLPNETYFSGLKSLQAPLLFWLSLPIVLFCVVPLYQRLRLETVFEYLELRYDINTRNRAVWWFVVWQGLWMAGVLCLPAKVLAADADRWTARALLVVSAGAVATIYTARGGLKAVIWTDGLAFVLVGIGLIFVVFSICNVPGESPDRIWSVAERLGRTSVADNRWDWSADWVSWAAVPFLVLVPMFFFLVDQGTVQRLLAVRGEVRADRAVAASFVLVTALLIPACYAGLGLLAVYQDHAQEEIPANWVVRIAVSPETGRAQIDRNTPINADTIGDLVAQGAILDPNVNRPIDEVRHLLDAEGRVNINWLATREVTGERRLRGGRDALLARFLSRHTGHVTMGLIVAAFLLVAMAAFDSGLAALGAVVVIDLHRRQGWLEEWLSKKQGKTPEELDQLDELRIARPAVVLVGAGTTAIALLLLPWIDPLAMLVGLINVIGGPLLCVFLLGIFTSRATGIAALRAAIVGALVGVWLTCGHHLARLPGLGWSWPWDGPLGRLWPFPLVVGTTLVLGYLLSFLLGARKSRRELRGLVVGCGLLGVVDLPQGSSREAAASVDRFSEVDSPWS